jgi:hypothetical protein
MINRRIAFLIHEPMLFTHYSGIWEKLNREEFVIVTSKFFYISVNGNKKTGSTEFLKKIQKLNYNLISVRDVIDCGYSFDIVISNHIISGNSEVEPHKNLSLREYFKKLFNRIYYWFNGMSFWSFEEDINTYLPLQIGKIQIRLMYSGGKLAWNTSDWNKMYDYIFVYGPYFTSLFSDLVDAELIEVGYPRFDDFFNTSRNFNELIDKYNLEQTKKTIVWMPTWGEYTSVGIYDDEISALLIRYNIIVKLHPLFATDSPDLFLNLQKYKFNCLISDDSDNLDLYRIADFMLCDYGGSPLAAIYTDKNFILLDVNGVENCKLIGEKSLELEIRKVFGSVSNEKNAIIKLLEDSSVWEKQSLLRKEIRATVFSSNIGTSVDAVVSNLRRILKKTSKY